MDEKQVLSSARSETRFGLLGKGLMFLVFILPVFFLPFVGIAPQVGKILLVEISAGLLFLLWLKKQIKTKSIKTKSSMLSLLMLAFSVLVTISSLLSQNFRLSMFGESFGSSEGIFLVSLGLIGFLSAQVFSCFRRVLFLYLGILIPFIFVILSQVTRFFVGSEFMSFGVFNSDIVTFVGGWNDLGLLSGFALLVSVVGLEFFDLNRLYRTALYVVLGLSVIGLFVVNVPIAWICLSFSTFIAFLYKVAFSKREKDGTLSKMPLVSLLVFIFAISGHVFAGDLVNSGLSSFRSVNYNEVRLTVRSTVSTVGDSFSKNLATGVGPNGFASLWNKGRSENASRLPVSDGHFQFGYSTLLTLFATLGLVGGVFVVFVMVKLSKEGIKALLLQDNSWGKKAPLASLFVTLSYLLLLFAIYVPGPLFMFYIFLFMGAFAGIWGEERGSKVWQIAGKTRPVVVAGSVVIAILFGLSFYQTSKKVLGIIKFQSAIASVDLQSKYEKGIKAGRTGKSSSYYRALSGLVRQQAVQLAIAGDIEEDDKLRSQLEFFLGQALSFSLEATKLNSIDYRNWLDLGDTYSLLRSHSVSGAYLNARQSYEKALDRNPKSHEVLSRLSVLELEEGNKDEAERFVRDMLDRRPGDAQALVLAARIAYEEGKLEDADRFAVTAAQVSTQNFGALMQIGVFVYNKSRHEIARDIFTQALVINPASLDAALGLAYSFDALGETSKSNKIIEDLTASGFLKPSDEREERPIELDSSNSVDNASPDYILNKETKAPEGISDSEEDSDLEIEE